MKPLRMLGLLALLMLALALAACGAPAAAPSQATAAPTAEATTADDGMTEMMLMMTTVAIAQGAPMLGIEGLTADLNTGDISLTPPNKTVATQLGDVTMTITPTLTVNLIRQRGTGAADMAFLIPGLGLYRQTSHFVFTPATGFAGGQTQIIRFNILGASLNADWTSDDDGLDGTAQLVYQPIGTLALEKWTVRVDPVTQQPITEMVIVGHFNLPDVHLGHMVAVEDLSGGLRIGLISGQSPTWQVAWQGRARVQGLPGDIDVAANTFRLTVDNGRVTADVRDVALTMAGQPLFEFAQSPN